MSDTFPILGNISGEKFLAEYWQKKPLLIRHALPDFESPISPDELAGLSLEEEIESRLVIEEGQDGPWQALHGPFNDETFSQLPEKKWTLLIQGADLWLPEVKSLLDHFTFIPPWRLDDVMISYAPEGGSVGPHYDYYDVFLLQGLGQRRWQVGPVCNQDSPQLDGTTLRILRDFDPTEDWVLNPGDMLYLPPQVAHSGVALNDCMTYSIGFRAPSATDMLDDLTTELLSQGNSVYYTDPALTPGMATENIDPAFIHQVKSLLSSVLDDEALLADWFARYMTAPKYPGLVDESEEIRRAKVNGLQYENGEPKA
ncbi:MAG: cupin domain-containing protein [Porticoccus sp.]